MTMQTRSRRRAALLLPLAFALLAPLAAGAQLPSPEEIARITKLAEEAGLPPPDPAKIDRIKELAKKRAVAARRQQTSSRVTRYLTAMVELIDEGEQEKALELAGRLNMDRLEPHERAQIRKVMAFAHYQNGDYDGAINSFQLVVDEQILQLEEEVQTRFSIIQLLGAQQRWEELIAALEERFEYQIVPEASALYLSAIAHYQLERFDEALFFANLAVQLEPEPKESWLQLVAALHVQNEDWVSAIPVLERLVTSFPKKQYWVQLSLIYGATDDYRHSLAVQQLAYLQGFLDQDAELRRLARSYLFTGLPYEAAQVLQKGIDDGFIEKDEDVYELLANSWIQAREFEKSVLPLREAAKISESGDLYVRLGQVHMQKEEWDDAAALFKQAIDKGNLKDMGHAQLLLGIAYYNSKRITRAMATFAEARKHERARKQADQWLSHIEKETQSS